MKLKFLMNRMLILMLLLTCLSPLNTHAQQAEIKVVSYNIRFDTDSDGVNAWQLRKGNFCKFLNELEPDVFGLQEVLQEQKLYIDTYFADYKSIGVGRDDGKTLGEYSPIFYNQLKFALLSSGTFWLSQTPHIPGSKGWDAACNRVVSYAGLRDLKTGKQFFVFNTHFDHMGEVARRNSSLLLLAAVDSIGSGFPCIITGDFNSTQSSEPYRIITDSKNPDHLIDSRLISIKNKGVDYSYTGFKVNGIEPELIDYIFVKKISKVTSFCIDNHNDGTYYPSDHLPVKAIIKL